MTGSAALRALSSTLAAHLARTAQPLPELADELGVDVATLRAWLAGRRPADTEFARLDTAVRFGEWLRARIAASGCTVREIAASTDNVSMGTIYNWIRGEHLPPPPAGAEPDRFDLLLSNPRLGLNLRQRLRLDEIRRRLTGTSTRIAEPGPDWPERGLPPANPSFTGRARELARLNRLLREYTRSDTGVVAALTGIGGVGKTALAVRWARSRPVRTTFTDGCLYLNLNGYADTSPLGADTALAKLLLRLNVRPRDIPADPDARQALYQATLAGRRLLLLLDNAHDEPQLRPLLPHDPACLTVVTSRNRLHGLAVTHSGVTGLPLDPLSEAEAGSLLRNILGRKVSRAEIDAGAAALAGACGRLPLALHIAAANYLTHHRPRGASPADYAATLVQDRLGQLVVGPSDPATTVTAALDRSYRHLGATAKRTYRLLGRHPGAEFTTAAAASLTGLEPDHATTVLTELAHANLLAQPAADRYGHHDLLHEHAADLDRRVGTDAAADERMVLHYLHTAHRGALLLEPHRRVVTPPRLPGSVTVTALADPAGALAWFDGYASTLVSLVEYCAENGHNAWCWQLAWDLTAYFHRHAHGRTWARVQRLALAAARRESNREWRAESHRMLGRALNGLDDPDGAREHLAAALAGFAELGDSRGQATTLKNLGFLEHRRGRDEVAAQHNADALVHYRRIGDRIGEADTLNNLGWCLAQTGHYDRAARHCGDALRLHRDLGAGPETANDCDSLGFIAAALGDHAGAAEHFRAAADEYESSMEHPFEAARSLFRLAEQLRAAGDVRALDGRLRRALSLLEQLNHPDAEALRNRIAASGTGPAPEGGRSPA